MVVQRFRDDLGFQEELKLGLDSGQRSVDAGRHYVLVLVFVVVYRPNGTGRAGETT